MPDPTAARPTPGADSALPPDVAESRSAGSVRLLRMGRNVLIGVVSLSILCLGASSFQGLASLKHEPPRVEPQTPVFQVEVYGAESADVRRVISAFGTARSDRIVVVSAEVPGRIVEADRLKVGRTVAGDHIEITADGRSERVAGDVLIRIDPQVYEQRVARILTLIEQNDVELRELEQNHATNQRLLEQQRERLATITAEYEAKKELVDKGAGSAAELRRVELDMKQYEEGVIRLEAEVELYDESRDRLDRQRAVHEADLELARIDVQKTTVCPPFPGIIAEVMAEEGQFVQTGEPLFEVTNNDLVEVPVAVSLADSVEIAAELSAGRFPEAALAESETAPARWFGNVLRMAPVADEQTRTVKMFIEVRNDEQHVPLRPGTFVHARIDGPVLRDAVLVPRDAIIDRAVYVVADGPSPVGESEAPHGVARRQEIFVDGTVQSLAVVRQGVLPGDRIVLTNLDVMEEGTLVSTGLVRTLDDELDGHQPAYVRRMRPGEIERPAGSGL